jgi:hypothetical protein
LEQYCGSCVSAIPDPEFAAIDFSFGAPKRLSIHSPNHHEFGAAIGLPSFNASSPFTHRIIVQTNHQIMINAPIAKCAVIAPTIK